VFLQNRKADIQTPGHFLEGDGKTDAEGFVPRICFFIMGKSSPNAAIVDNLELGDLASDHGKGLFRGDGDGQIRWGFGMQNVSPWRKCNQKITLAVGGEPHYLFLFWSQDGQGSRVGSVRAWSFELERRAHWTNEHLYLNASICRDGSRARNHEQKNKNGKITTHNG
jgi:hypothetical protein